MWDPENMSFLGPGPDPQVRLTKMDPPRSGFPGKSQKPSKKTHGTLSDTLNPNPPKKTPIPPFGDLF